MNLQQTPQSSIPHGNLNPTTPLSASLHPNHNTDLTTKEYRWRNTASKIKGVHNVRGEIEDEQY